MEPKTVWKCLDDDLLIQKPNENINHGKNSNEKKNQAMRESIFGEIVYPSKY